MIPIFSVVGWSNSGKTTLICKLLPELNRRGYRVATVKHDVHGFDWDQPGKDTWLHRKAGAFVSAISSPHRFALVRELDEELSLDEIAQSIKGVDLIITEGYKFGDKPKLEVFRKKQAKKIELVAPTEHLFAVAGDYPFELNNIPLFDLEDIAGMVNIIEKNFLD